MYADAKIGPERGVNIDEVNCLIYEMERFEGLYSSVPDSEPMIAESKRGECNRVAYLRESRVGRDHAESD